jgi:chromosome segregation protein
LAARDALIEAEQGLTAATLAMADAESEQVRAATAQAVAVRELPALREAEARAAAAVQRLRIAASDLDQEEARIRVRIGELDQRLTDLAADIVREQQMLADHGGALEKLDDEEADLGIEAETALEAMETARATLAEREADLSASDRALAAATAALADIQARRQQLDRAIREASERTLRCEAEIATVERELAAIEKRLADAPEVAAGRATLEAAEAALDQSEALALEAEAACAAARETEARKRPPVVEIERELARLEAEAAALAKVISATSGSTQPLIDAMRVAAGFETALGAALGSDIDVSLDRQAPVHWSTPGEGAADPALPAGTVPILNEVDAPDRLRRRLRQIGVVDRADGAALQADLHPGQCLVSREGDVWRWDGYRAAADAPSAAALRLAQRNRLAELERLSETARARFYAARAELDMASRAVRVTAETERVARDQWRRDQRIVSEARDSLARAERDLGQVTARLSALEEAKARLSVGRDEARAALDAAQANLAAIPTVDAPTRALMEGRAAVAQHRAAVAEARAAVGTLNREAELRVRRLEAIARERRGWQDRARNAQAQIGVLDQRRADMRAERETLDERPNEIAFARRRLLTEIANAETARSAAADHLAKGEVAVAEADRLARSRLDALAEARIALGRSEERRDAARQRRDEVGARIADQFEIDPPALAALIETLPPPAEDGEAMERRLERLKLERERLGGVNLRADDEAAEVEARRDALTRERDDLDGAIQRLRTGIATLNRDARDRLQASFDIVNQHFKELFTRLFNGGDAELRLVDSDDPLDAGLEIIARPPGKKPQTMTLLSGGEQALTAMALIFAVFLTNPAPICVLDEVDAPLDDANVERYCDLLDAMTRQTKTRFIVITHNPITMARMDRLFGVTMAEKGVSQLVSVDLETAERFLEAV